jgi:hypothetical protein
MSTPLCKIARGPTDTSLGGKPHRRLLFFKLKFQSGMPITSIAAQFLTAGCIIGYPIVITVKKRQLSHQISVYPLPVGLKFWVQ